VLQNLLDEGVNIRDMRTIIETLAELVPRVQDPIELTSQVRIALGRAIVQQLSPPGNEMQVMALEPGLERLLGQALQGGGDAGGIEPGLADTLLRETAAAARHQEDLGLPAVLLVPPHLRWLLSRFLRRAVQQLRVISNGEVPDSKIIKVTSIIGARK
jgi:flagellar biosynthesis protein FlhA